MRKEEGTDIVTEDSDDTLGDYTGIYSYRKSTFPLRIHNSHNTHQSFRDIA